LFTYIIFLSLKKVKHHTSADFDLTTSLGHAAAPGQACLHMQSFRSLALLKNCNFILQLLLLLLLLLWLILLPQYVAVEQKLSISGESVF
jgi:hypothetical protein